MVVELFSPFETGWDWFRLDEGEVVGCIRLSRVRAAARESLVRPTRAND